MKNSAGPFKHHQKQLIILEEYNNSTKQNLAPRDHALFTKYAQHKTLKNNYHKTLSYPLKKNPKQISKSYSLTSITWPFRTLSTIKIRMFVKIK